jgi:hypothetical protein
MVPVRIRVDEGKWLRSSHRAGGATFCSSTPTRGS